MDEKVRSGLTREGLVQTAVRILREFERHGLVIRLEEVWGMKIPETRLRVTLGKEERPMTQRLVEECTRCLRPSEGEQEV